MPNGSISIDEVIKKTLSGIVKAQKDYEYWSGGYWLWEAPEYMLTTYIAREICTIHGAYYLTLESNVRGIVEDAGGIGRGRLHEDVRLGGRSDITLWWGGGTPRAAVEVKNQVSNAAKIRDDIIRIKTLLRNEENTFQCGLVAFYTSRRDRGGDGERARATIKERLANIKSETQDILGEEHHLRRHDSRIRVDGDSAWVASVLLIQ